MKAQIGKHSSLLNQLQNGRISEWSWNWLELVRAPAWVAVMPLVKEDTTLRSIRRRWELTSKLVQWWISAVRISTTIGPPPLKNALKGALGISIRCVISIYRGVLNNYGTSIDAEQRKSAVERQGTDSSSVDTGSPSASESSCATATACDSEPDRSEEQLPPGWEKHEGTYNTLQINLIEFLI
jgi:hypothetical protein